LTSETRATARISGMIVPKSPKDPASSERENFSGIGGVSGTVSAGFLRGILVNTGFISGTYPGTRWIVIKIT
jgi:hypothetical protein